MKIKLCQSDGYVLGYVKADIATEAEVPDVLEFQGQEYVVTHRIVLSNNLIKVIVKPDRIKPAPKKKMSLWQKLFRR